MDEEIEMGVWMDEEIEVGVWMDEEIEMGMEIVITEQLMDLWEVNKLILLRNNKAVHPLLTYAF
jgi:hypothetical protein